MAKRASTKTKLLKSKTKSKNTSTRNPTGTNPRKLQNSNQAQKPCSPQQKQTNKKIFQGLQTAHCRQKIKSNQVEQTLKKSFLYIDLYDKHTTLVVWSFSDRGWEFRKIARPHEAIALAKKKSPFFLVFPPKVDPNNYGKKFLNHLKKTIVASEKDKEKTERYLKSFFV
jgi:hypothetical protein